MLNRETQRTLSELLMKIIEGENKIELYRKCLNQNIDFNPNVLFKSLFQVYPDSILPKDLKEFLQSNSEIVSDQEVYLLVRQYSALQNGRLNNEDFLHFIVTSTDDSLARISSERYHIRDVSSGVRFSFISLLKEELKLQKDIESLKTKLFQDSDFSLWKAFEALNSAGKGYITESDIVDYLKKFGRYIGTSDYDALMRRIDLEDDLVISYNEFLEALIPLKVPSHDLKSNSVREDFKSNSISKDFKSNSIGQDFKSYSVTKQNKVENEEEHERKESKLEIESEDKEENNEENNEEKEDQEHFEDDNEEFKESKDHLRDEPFDTNDLEKSPRFRESTDTAHQDNYHTPEKIKDKNSRAKSLEISQKISQILLLKLEDERMIEYTRQNLMMQENFSIRQAFKLIDKEEKNIISIKDFQIFLGELNLETLPEILASIFRKIKENKDGDLDEQDFCKFFLPHDDEYKEFLKIDLDEPLNQSTIEKIRDVLEVMIIAEEKLQKLKAELLEHTEEEIKDVFSIIDIDDDGEISSEDLKQFFKRLGRNISEKDSVGIIENYTGNKSIYFNEFKTLISA